MATYFHLMNSEIQGADGMQTLYLMNPNYVPYSDTASLPNNALLLNPVNQSHAPPPPNDHHYPLVGIPLPPLSTNTEQTSSEDMNRSSSFQAIVPGVHYDLWSSIDHNSGQNHTQMVSLAASVNNSNQLGLLRPAVSSASCRQQGLSLSLSSQTQKATAAAYNRPINTEANHHIEGGPGPVTVITSGDLMRVSESSPSSVSVVSNGISSMRSAILGSKYLRAAQEVLDEVVKVENVIIKTDSIEGTKDRKTKLNKESSLAAIGEESNGGESSTKPSAELTTAQRQELQIKKAKLGNMLEEVEQRYKQYYHQMQVVVAAFEQAAGLGSAKSYTSLALRTISKQFRCLKDAISLQIKATTKKLGEDDCLGAKAETSRLRYVDHQLRQQRVLQQLGTMQHHAWRPQRGLPERAVTILRAWLFEHFLHPYPKDSDKHILAKQTGLTRSQVSNWFINARVRLWKPMVEEMYLEEIKEQERNGSENASKITESKDPGSNPPFPEEIKQVKAIQSKGETSNTHQIASPTAIPVSTSPTGGTLQAQTGFNLIGPSDHLEGVVLRRQKKLMNAEMQNSTSRIISIDHMDMKQGETSREIGMKFSGRETISKDGYPLITRVNGGGFGAYSMGADIGRFNPDHQLTATPFHGNGVSLTLGLPHCENLPPSGTQQNLLSGGVPDFCGIDTTQPPHSNAGYESVGIQNRKRFAAQLLQDFVT